MKIKTIFYLFIFLGVGCILNLSCSKDENTSPEPESREEEEVPNPVPNDDIITEDPTEEEVKVEFLNANLTYDGYVLINDAGKNRVYIMDKEATILHEWSLSNNIGNDVVLLPDGRLLASLEADDPLIAFGGKGGKIQFVDKDSRIDWNFEYATEDYITHHDVEILPNGNVIALVWERMPVESAQELGWVSEVDIFTEAVIEINPSTDEIVWEWHAWDHLIQDKDDTKTNYGSVSDNPQLIDINYNSEQEDGDIMHANGIAYDEINDLIYISVNFYHEVWVIDHSTSTEQAASSAGGTLGKGGNLVYRFGNPGAYKNDAGERLFHNNHFPNLLDGGDLLIFVNMMQGMEQSAVYELDLPDGLDLRAKENNEPTVTWSFTDPDLYSPKVSGAVLLPNGNTMITEGDFGVWEVTPDGEVVWKFSAPGFFWRAYHYDKNAPGLTSLGL
ncbi:aryl-sulfate sulfotransferase [Ulvibacterium sp.]|uniref:aryl-sulfate sulfotransferase n=1 Tax=Ulvibacterium sp. TaxID=2665914 RepID=UPI003BA8CEF1